MLSQHLHVVGIYFSIEKIQKILRLREVMQFAQHHRARKTESLILKFDSRACDFFPLSAQL